MDFSRNRVELIGRLGQTPMSAVTPGGQRRAILRLATNEQARKADGTAVEHTEWHQVVLFGPAAKNAGATYRTGDLVLVEGYLRTEFDPPRRGSSKPLPRKVVYARECYRLGRSGEAARGRREAVRA